MTWRGLPFLLVCVAAFAQLPPSQAPMPREGSSFPGRIDASVTDLEGRPITGLKAAEFTLEANGKPQKIESATVEQNQPLRLAVLIDDLSLPLDRLNAARRALREFVANGLRDGDEMAILRSGFGSGGLDAFTSDKAALDDAIDRARHNPASEDSTAESFAAGAINAARGALEGMREFPGRKALLLISERLGDKARALAGGSDPLARAAHRAAAVLYAFDAAPVNQPALVQGLAASVKETGGRVFDSGGLAAALAGIAREQRTYYVLTFGNDDLGFDYIARTPKVEKVVLQASGKDAQVRARSAYFGAGEDYENGETELDKAAGADWLSGGVRARLTAMLSVANTWQVDVVAHLDGRDLTFVKGTDGVYRARIDTSTALVDHTGQPVKQVSRSFQAQLTEASWKRLHGEGLDYTVALALPRDGSYMAYSVVRDGISGKIGSTRQFLRAGNLKDHFLMSSIVVRGVLEKNAEGVDTMKDPLESGAVRAFKAGHAVTYEYHLYNVAANADKRSEIETHSEIWRDGVRVYNAEPRTVEFPPAENPGRRSVSGMIALSGSMAPGGYLLRVTVTDRLTKRSASQWMDFEVRP